MDAEGFSFGLFLSSTDHGGQDTRKGIGEFGALFLANISTKTIVKFAFLTHNALINEQAGLIGHQSEPISKKRNDDVDDLLKKKQRNRWWRESVFFRQQNFSKFLDFFLKVYQNL